MDWLIVSPGNGDGFILKLDTDLVETDYVIARHPSSSSAIEGIERAQRLEQQMRPLWLAAFECERRTRNTMLETVYAAARPIQPSTEGETK